MLARRGTRWYHARKFLRRHRVEAIAAALVIASLVGGTTVAVRQAALAGRERDRAEQALVQSKEVTNFLVRLFRTPAPAGATRDQVTARDMLATGTAGVEALRAQPVVQAQMLDALGQVNEQLGRFAEAERMLRRALELRRAHLGENHLDVAATLNNLSNVLVQTDRREESLQMSREALAIQQRVLGPRHLDVAATLLAVAARTTDLTAAESLYRAVRDIQRVTLGPENRAVALTNRDLANNLTAQGKHEDAEATLRETIAIQGRLTGLERASAATTMIVLGNLLSAHRGRPAEAESLYHRAIDILKQEAPDRPARLIGALYGLEGIAHLRGDHARAEALARQVLDVQQRTIGTEHPMVTESMDAIAEHLAAQQRYADAERILRDATTLLERTVGADHFRMADRLTTLGRVRTAAGQLDAAEADFRRGLAIMEHAQGPNSESVAVDAALLADVLARRGQTAEANAQFDRAATILRSIPPRAGYGMRAAYAALAEHYGKPGRPDDEAFFRQRMR